MSVKLLGHLTSFSVGAAVVDPSSSIYDGVHHVIAAALPGMTVGDTSEILRLLAGLIIGVLSKFIYGFIDKKFKENNKTDDEEV